MSIKGTITEVQADGMTYLPYAERSAQLQKKSCARAKCPWKTIKKFKTVGLRRPSRCLRRR